MILNSRAANLPMAGLVGRRVHVACPLAPLSQMAHVAAPSVALALVEATVVAKVLAERHVAARLAMPAIPLGL
jgi:hypothetical protein